MTMLVQRPERSPYTDAEVTVALTALAMNSGSLRRTGRETGIPESTLRDWRKANLEEYERIAAEKLPEVYASVAALCEGLALEQADLEAKIAQRLEDKLDELRPGEAASALRNVAVSKAVNIDKASLIRGRPSEIRMELGVEALVKAIGREFGPVLPAVDSTAEDMDAEGGGGVHPSARTPAQANAQAQDARPSAPHATAQD